MPLGLVALFHPRMEMDHLEEWITYHAAVGVSRFYLYNNGHISKDPLFAKGKAERVWGKKPEANYHLDLTDDEVDQRVSEIVSQFSGLVKVNSWQSGKGHGRSFRDCQRSAANHELRRQKKKGEVDWLGHIDIDELLVFGEEHGTKFLYELDSDIAALRISQKLFESRWQNGQSVAFSEITNSFGVLNFNRKLIARVSQVSRWKNPHSIKATGQVWKVPPKIIRFHHFRGNKHFGPEPPKGWGIRRYRRIPNTKTQHDDAHVRVG